MVTAVLGAVGAFLQGWFISPAELGYFRKFGIINDYLFFLHLGIFHAVERFYPYYIGRGETRKALDMVGVSGAWILAVSVLLSAAFCVLSIVAFAQGNWKEGLGWLSQSVLIIASLYGGFLNATYRSGNDFKKMASVQMWGAPVSFLVLPVFWVQSYVGLFLRTVVPSLVVLWRLHVNRPLKLTWRFSWCEWREVVRQGLPRFTASYMLTTGLEAVRFTIILQFLGTEALGYWAFAWALIMLAQQIPQAMTAVYLPRVSELYGKTDSSVQCTRLCRKPVLYGMAILAIIVPIGMVATKYLMPLLLPKYAQAAGLVCVLLLSLPLKLLDAPSSVLSAMDWMGWLNVRAGVSAALDIGCCLLGIALGWGLYGVAMGLFAGSVLRAVILWIILRYAWQFERSERRATV